MEALVVIDVQNAIVNMGDFSEALSVMERVIHDFKASGRPVIFMRHVEDAEESPLHRGAVGAELHDSLKDYADYVIEKQTPSSFFRTQLAQTLERLGVKHLFLTGFETEFCCMFTAIAAYDRGYQVTVIKDAMGTTNTAESYAMPGLDINQFVGKVLSWSNAMEVIDYKTYVERYNALHTERENRL